MDREIKPRFQTAKKMIWPAVGVAVVAFGIWAIVKSRTSTYEADTTAMLFGTVTEGEFHDYIRFNGRVETGTVVHVSALESGIVEHKWVEEGAAVKAGDIILTLHNPNLRQQILDSESQLAEKQNMLRETELSMERDGLDIKRQLLSATTEMSRKKRAMDQQQALYDEKLTSREEYLQACEDYELARESYTLLRDRLCQDSAYRAVQIGMMRESLDNMRENFELVRSRADNLDIRASHSGQLGSLNAQLGQSITSGQQIGQINITDSYKIAADIDEFYIDRVVTGLKGTVERGNQRIGVVVTKVYPEVVNNRFKADLVIDGDMPDNIRVGQTYHVRLETGEPSVSLMVPRGTFFSTTGGKWAYVLSDDGKTATRRDITIGRQNPDFYEVTGGLEPGERIITSSYSDFGEADKIILKKK